MKLRSSLKIEKLVLKEFPDASPFHPPTYNELYAQYSRASKDWERQRDTFCKATVNSSCSCVCNSHPSLVNHPLRLNFQRLADEINVVDREAYIKLTAARNNLRAIYFRINELKDKFHDSK